VNNNIKTNDIKTSEQLWNNAFNTFSSGYSANSPEDQRTASYTHININNKLHQWQNSDKHYVFDCDDDMVAVTLVNESCSPQWKELPYTSDNSRSFTKHWTPKTLKQCQDMCLFNPRCVAVIWPPCYIYTSLGTSNRDVRYNTYKLVKRCDITSGLYFTDSLCK